MQKRFTIYCLLFLLILNSCNKKEDVEINLKWYKSYPEDSFKRNLTGLKWSLSYLGASVPMDTTLLNINYQDSIIKLNIDSLGLTNNARKNLSRLNYIFKSTEDYKTNNSIDLGRYIALTFGNSHHYFAITEVPKSLEAFNKLYTFSESKGYIDDSSVSLVDRIIYFSDFSEDNRQGYLSVEIDSISKDTLEYETMEIMPNGQLKFGIYDINGELKDAGNNTITRAGKPAKCIWCHEVVIQPLFRDQQNHDSYLSYLKLNDTLEYFNGKLQYYQNSIWKDSIFLNRRKHTELELVYIAFMEPTAERISQEWHMPLNEVKQKLSHLKTHKHHEFPFLGDLYHRKDIDLLSPFDLTEVSESIREKSNNEVNLLK